MHSTQYMLLAFLFLSVAMKHVALTAIVCVHSCALVCRYAKTVTMDLVCDSTVEGGGTRFTIDMPLKVDEKP